MLLSHGECCMMSTHRLFFFYQSFTQPLKQLISSGQTLLLTQKIHLWATVCHFLFNYTYYYTLYSTLITHCSIYSTISAIFLDSSPTADQHSICCAHLRPCCCCYYRPSRCQCQGQAELLQSNEIFWSDKATACHPGPALLPMWCQCVCIQCLMWFN